jgi:general secretion pathway protein M
LAILAAVVFGIGWPWLQQVANLKHEIESLNDQTSRYRRLIQTLPGLRAELDQVRSNEDVKDLYFNAKTPALAGAQIQREVQKMVNASGARLVSTQVLASDDKEQPPKVRVRAQIQGKTDALKDILYDLEKARPFLFVDQMSIRSTARRTTAGRNPRARGRQRRRSVRRQPQGMLTVRLDVFGYALGEAP